MAANSALKISYYAKETTCCPVCNTEFHREELLSGSGRLIAGELTDELHRLYEVSSKYGRLYPLAYIATVCPSCWYASMDSDFTKLPQESIHKAINDQGARMKDASLLYPDISFEDLRNLASGAISQYLVLRCYDYFPSQFSPTIKQAVSALRAAWLFDELDKVESGQNFDWLAVLFKKKARFFYAQSLKKEQAGKESLSGLSSLGPDTDKNYGYEGLLYLTGLLEYKYGDTNDPEKPGPAFADPFG
ncbi:MAG: DUF2225 domain-containing protein, partial [Spirochaetaceae bacterium]|nr:DUF2225 domain-containing protein [Spirochaetaceae bacterium]